MKPLNLNNVQIKTSGGTFDDVKPGGYICRIMNVTDVPEREYLRVDLDIASGEYKNFYTDLAGKFGFWGCTQYWSYKDKNLGFFKGNIRAVEESNPGFVFTPDEQELRGKLVGAVFGEEEYMTSRGDLRCNTKPRFVCSAQRIVDNDYKVPQRRVYDPSKDKRAKNAGGRADILTPVMDEVSAVKSELNAWAESQKLPWED